MRPKQTDSIRLAQYILAKVGKANHLKLQKLVFYVEAYHLAYFDGESIIADDFEAWLHGPVSRKLWDHLKPIANVYDDVSLDVFLGGDEKEEVIRSFKSSISDEQASLIEEVIKAFGKKDSYYLERLTHAEDPWKIAREGYADDDKCEVVIDKKIMTKYYKKNIYN